MTTTIQADIATGIGVAKGVYTTSDPAPRSEGEDMSVDCLVTGIGVVKGVFEGTPSGAGEDISVDGFVSGIATAKAVYITSSPAIRNVSLDQVFDCLGYDRDGNPYQGVVYGYCTVDALCEICECDCTAIGYGTASGTVITGVVVDVGPVTGYGIASGDIVLQGGPRSNWIRWSNIGDLDFTIREDNIAGARPLDWQGHVWNLRKLGNKVVAYGENGVSFLLPVENKFGLNTIHRVGLLGRDAFAGTDFVHWFVDKLGCLYQLGESLQLIDYREYLSSLSSPVLSYDEANNLLYICDGSTGYVYSPDSKSLGQGPANITGIGYQSGVQYAVAPAAISIPKFEIWTGAYDLGSRRGKNIHSVEVGVDLDGVLSVSVRLRLNKASSWTQTPWYHADPRGVAFIPCYGYEFKFGVKADVYESFEPDYIRVEGEVNAY